MTEKKTLPYKMEVNKVNKKIKVSTMRRKQWMWGYLMIAPVVIGLGVFYIYPFFDTLLNSFKTIGAFNVSRWCGLENYQTLLTDESLAHTLFNTFRYVILTVPLTIIFALLLAVLLNTKGLKGRGLYRVIYFLPYVTMAAAIAAVWKWMFNGDFGLINYILGLFGIEGQQWVTNENLAPYSIIVVTVWGGIGYNMIILLAGIQGISKTYYEAAEIDGAGVIAKFFKITLPLVTPSLFFILITGLIGAFQIFDTIYMMIGKNRVVMENTQSVVMYFYRNAFELGNRGYACAIAMLLFVIIMIITLIQMKGQKKWVNYD